METHYSTKQESIPVGGVPSAAVAICLGGVCFGMNVCPGGYLPGGCLPRGCLADIPHGQNYVADGKNVTWESQIVEHMVG